MAETNSSMQIDWNNKIKDLHHEATTVFAIPTVIMVASMILLLVTIVSIVKSPQRRGSMQGKLIAWQSGTLLIGYFFSTFPCLSLLVLVYYPLTGFILFFFSINVIFIFTGIGVFYLSSHFWLNALCFEIFLRFRSLNSMVLNKDGSRINFRFGLYCSYAILTPIFLTTVAVVSIVFFDVDLLIDLVLVYCLPVLTLTVANLTFFSITLRNVLKMKKESNILLNNESKSSEAATISSVWLSLKMLLSMLGVTWIFEVALIIALILELPMSVIIFTAFFTSLRGITLSIIYLIFNRNKSY